MFQSLTFPGCNRGAPQLSLGGLPIPDVSVTPHLGIPLGSISETVITEIINKGKRCCAALQGLCRSGTILDPGLASKLYWSIVIPSMLHGIEILYLSEPQIQRLNCAHVHMARNIQGLPGWTPSDAILPQIGWVSLESHIKRKAMLMMYKLLTLSMRTVAKQVVLIRLTQLRHSGTPSPSPIGLMYSYLKEYNLEWLVHQILDSGIVPSYNYWKKSVQYAVMSAEDRRQALARQLHPSLACYDIVIGSIKMCIWWNIAIAHPKHREKCRQVMAFICAYDTRFRFGRCQLCSSYEADTVSHLVTHCDHFLEWRTTLYQNMTSHCNTPEYHGEGGLVCHILRGGCNDSESLVILDALYTLVIETHYRKSLCEGE